MIWTLQISGTLNPLSDIAYGNGKYVVVGSYGDIITSPDAVTWTPRSSPTNNGLSSVIYANGKFVAVGAFCILNSSDGITWTSIPFSPQGTVTYLTYAKGQFVAVEQDVVGNFQPTTPIAVTSNILISVDGVTWAEHAVATTNVLNGIAFGNDRFVVVQALPPRMDGYF